MSGAGQQPPDGFVESYFKRLVLLFPFEPATLCGALSSARKQPCIQGVHVHPCYVHCWNKSLLSSWQSYWCTGRHLTQYLGLFMHHVLKLAAWTTCCSKLASLMLCLPAGT